MDPHNSRELKNKHLELESAQQELEQLTRQLSSFESLVDAHLGELLDQLSELNAQTQVLDAELRHIREERLYGKDRMSYVDGAPLPGRPINLGDLPHQVISHREAIHAKVGDFESSGQRVPDIKVLYRKLARRYHPDLARTEADRAASNAQMSEINRAYNAGDLKALMQLAGMVLPYGVELPQPSAEMSPHHIGRESEQEQVQRKLKSIRQQINRMSDLPIVKLSLEVKLAQHQGRNLLREMEAELRYKVGRKIAEKDYLQAQVKASGG